MLVRAERDLVCARFRVGQDSLGEGEEDEKDERPGKTGEMHGCFVLKDCLIALDCPDCLLQMLPCNRPIYHTRLGPGHPPAETTENQLYAHANMRRFYTLVVE